MSDPQRTWANIGLRDSIKVQLYDPFSQGGQAYLGSADIEVSFASTKKRVEAPYDQDDLAKAVIKVGQPSSIPRANANRLQNFENQLFSPGQRILMDHKSIPLLLQVKTVQRVDLTSEKVDLSSGHIETDPVR